MAQAVTGHDEAVMLDAAHLSRSFGTRLAVDDVSFHVAPGETYGLLGPNGAGKTTTIRLVCGLLSADSGQITVSGMPVSTSTTTAKAQIGYVPQDVALYPDLTARENLSFFGRLYRLSGKALGERMDEVLELIDLTDAGGRSTLLGRQAGCGGFGSAAPRADGDAARRHASADRHELLRAGHGDLLHVLRHRFRRARLLPRTHRGDAGAAPVAPIGPRTILAGKSLATFVYGVASLGTVAIVTSLVFDAHWGPPLVVLALIMALSLTMVGLTALVITVARTERQADGFASLLTFGLVLLGGNFVFFGSAPPLLRTLALLTPNGWALRAFTDLAGGAAWTAALVPLMAILAFALATGAVAYSLRRRVAVP